MVPWDSDIFGFPVAQYRIGSERIEESQLDAFRGSLLSWLNRNGVALCSCAIPAPRDFWRGYLPHAGFQFVDVGLQAALKGLQGAQLPPARSKLRKAEPCDSGAIEAIAEGAFHHGRYHADPRFPRELADRRYRRWVANALAGTSTRDSVYVMGEPGRVLGFYHVTVEGPTSDLRLAALALELQGSGLGFDLYLAMLHVLKELGIRRVVTSISACNTAVMNVYSMLGFSFSEPEVIYHWHAPGTQPGLV
jgi:RimJ/RimL family protein N-acetyltransferase